MLVKFIYSYIICKAIDYINMASTFPLDRDTNFDSICYDDIARRNVYIHVSYLDGASLHYAYFDGNSWTSMFVGNGADLTGITIPAGTDWRDSSLF